jgi:MerR family transcriptional regulator, repressor of the yfmOP operon
MMADTVEQGLYTIEQVATRTGFTKRTLRYYEEVGVLSPTGRTEGNYRLYSEADVERLERIRSLRELLGFSLADIREIMEAEDERVQIRDAYKHETEVAAKVAQLNRADDLIRHQLQLIEKKLAGLEQMRMKLLENLERHEQKRTELFNTK